MQGFLLSQGRFTFALLQTGMDFSGLKQPELAGLGFFLSAGGLILVCWVTLASWLRRHLLLAISVGAMLGAHPFFTEYVSFRQSLFPMGVCFVLIASACVLLDQGEPITTKRLCAAAGLAAMAAGINQLAMAFFCIAALGISLQKEAQLSPLRAMFLAVRNSVLAGALASIFYLLIFAATNRMANVATDPRMSMLASGEVSRRVGDVAVLLVNVFGGTHPLIGPLAAIGTAVAIVILAVRVSTRSEQWAQVAVGALVLAMGVILALLPASVSGVWWPVPRTLVALPLALALGIATFSLGASRGQVRLASGALFMMAAIFAGKSGSLLVDQQRLNRWDISLAREIFLKIAQDRQADTPPPIVIHRAKWAYELGQSMPIGDANVSAFSVAWSVDALFEEATGRRVQVTVGAEADKICANVPSFPASASIIDLDGTKHVCL